MDKRNIFYSVGAGIIGAGALSYFLMNDEQKSKLKHSINHMLHRDMVEPASTFEKAGQPDQVEPDDIADLENAKMVSEGSQFGVQYYNEKRDELPLQ